MVSFNFKLLGKSIKTVFFSSDRDKAFTGTASTLHKRDIADQTAVLETGIDNLKRQNKGMYANLKNFSSNSTGQNRQLRQDIASNWELIEERRKELAIFKAYITDSKRPKGVSEQEFINTIYRYPSENRSLFDEFSVLEEHHVRSLFDFHFFYFISVYSLSPWISLTFGFITVYINVYHSGNIKLMLSSLLLDVSKNIRLTEI